MLINREFNTKNIMKLIKLIFAFFPLIWLASCQEEKNTPFFAGEKPQPITDYTVENLSGAAAISFKLNDPNAAYVKAVYSLKEGLVREAKASRYDNKLIVDGFSEEKAYTVQLYAVSKDEQDSDPTMITVNPSKAPHKRVVEELTIDADWGGGKIEGPNPTSAKLMIGVIKKNAATGEWEDVEAFFTEASEFKFNFRGLNPVESTFGVYTRDQWQNFSDTLTYVFTPWEEIKLPLTSTNPAHFIEIPGDSKASSTAYALRRIFDGAKATWADGYYSVAEAKFPKYITIDLLASYQLSRFKYWQNNNLYYQSANAKHIRIWGNNTPSDDMSTWYLLGEWDNWRPSGRPPTSLNAGLTEADLAAAQAGNDFDFPLDIPAARYIRIETVSTWEPRTQVYYPELEFWGREIR